MDRPRRRACHLKRRAITRKTSRLLRSYPSSETAPRDLQGDRSGSSKRPAIALPLDGATTLESHATPAHDQSTTTFPWHCGPNPSGIGTTARCMPIRVVGQRTGGIARAAPVFVPRRPIRTRRLLKVLLECRQLSPTGAEVWRRITAWTRFNEAGAEAALTAYASGVTSTQTTVAG